jgi:HTH-type transcriptional regulator/antitoxin HigA
MKARDRIKQIMDAQSLPLRIASEPEYTGLLTAVEALMEKAEDTLSPEENALLSLLVTLVETYEKEHYRIPHPSPPDMVQYLMEQRELNSKDLWRLFGSKGSASEVLNGKRAISKMQAKKLAEFFHVSPSLFT